MKSSGARHTPEYLPVGRVLRPHGIRGALLVESDSDVGFSISTGSTIYLGDEDSIFTVQSFSKHRKQYLLKLENMDSREAAEAYRDRTILILFENTEPLAENVFYHWQLKGLSVVKNDGQILGELVDIIVAGANDVYIVRSDSGEEILLPAIKSVVEEVDLERGKMIVNIIAGLLD